LRLITSHKRKPTSYFKLNINRIQATRKDHPCKSLTIKTKKKPIQLQDLFSKSELEFLMQRENRYEIIEIRNKLIISLLIYQGFLGTEIVNLKLKDIDLEQGTVYVKGSKNLSSRLINLKINQIVLLQNYISNFRDRLNKYNLSYLIITMRGQKETVDGIHELFSSFKHAFPHKKINPTTIRQSVISNLLNEEKHSIEAVQLFAGHKWPSTTEQYKRLDIDSLVKKINKWHPLG
jgi:integrase/recombinase XerD